MAALRNAHSPFEQWALDNQYDISPAVSPAENRVYADRHTQSAYEAWCAGAASAKRNKNVSRPQIADQSSRPYRIYSTAGGSYFEGQTYRTERSAKVSRSRGLYGGGLKSQGFTEADFPILFVKGDSNDPV